MIAVIAIAAVAIAYRVKARLFTKAEFAVLSIFIVHLVMVELQISICDHSPFPEKRYWVQAGVLLSGWAVWGLVRFSAALSSRFRPARYLLPAAVVCLAAVEVAMIAKPHVPFSRRYAHLRAVDWAEEMIRADWKGPSKDKGIEFITAEYRQPNRPIVRAHTARLPYVLNGRNDSVSQAFEDDTPDYICDEEGKIDLLSESLHGAKYELMEKAKFGRRTFALYRRVRKGPAR